MTTHMKKILVLEALVAIGLLAAPFTAAQAAATTASAQLKQAESRFRMERDNCLAGRTIQDKKTCLKEAHAALYEARMDARHPGRSGPKPDYAANAHARCDRLPEADKSGCHAMVEGQGTVVGSVSEGAMVKELRQLETNPPAAGKPQ